MLANYFVLHSTAFLLFIYSIYVLLRNVGKEGSDILFRFEFWPLIYSIGYCLTPVMFSESILKYYKFSSNIYLSSELASVVSLYLHAVLLVNFLCSKPYAKSKFLLSCCDKTVNIMVAKVRANIVSWSFIIILGLLVVQFFLNPPSASLASSLIFNYEESSLNSSYRLIKNLAYLCIALFPVLFYLGRKLEASILTLLFLLIDLLHGYRTTAYIAIISFFICLISSTDSKSGRNKIAIIMMTMLSWLFVYAVYLRGKLSFDQIDFIYESLGEFFVTYIAGVFAYSSDLSLPAPEEFIGYSLSGLMPGFLRQDFFENFAPIGQTISDVYGGGFGLGTPISYEPYYYYGFLGIIVSPFLMCLVAVIIRKFCKKSQLGYISNLILYAIFARLFFRDGLIYNFSLIFYMLIFISALSIILKKRLYSS